MRDSLFISNFEMLRREHKLFFYKSLKFIACFLVLDLVLGFVAKKAFFSQSSGRYARITYSINQASDDILILGSSHANRHYVPKVFEEELNMSCYNAGVQGQTLIFHSTLQKMILSRTTPKMMILNVDYDMLNKSVIVYDKLSDLYPYYWKHRDILKPILSLQSILIDYKMLLQSYQTNSTIVHIIKYLLFHQTDYKGYRPLSKRMKAPNKLDGSEEGLSIDINKELDKNFINAFESFIINGKQKNIKLILSTSPTVNKMDLSKSKSYATIKEIANKYHVPFYDFNNDIRFLYKYELFKDETHLNSDGADKFSKILVQSIKTSYQL